MHYRADDVRKLASEFARFGEVVAGSEKEHHLLEVVRSLVEGYADKIVVEPVPVTTWREELCVIEAGGKIYSCSIQPPYNGYIDVEFSPSQAVVVSLYDLSHGKVGKDTIYGRVVVVDVPRNPDDIADVAIELLSMEPSLIIFSDPVDSLRRIVVLNKLIELYEYAEPPKTPVIIVPRSSVRELLSNDVVRVLSSSIARESYGYNLVAWRFGGGDNNLYIAAHHDHWFQGASDDVLGVAIAVELFRKPPAMLSRHSIALALFTAEEGFPEKINSFYWLVGSRHFVSKHFNELVEELLALVNIDVVYGERVKGSIIKSVDTCNITRCCIYRA
jgi:Iap family predicted aminopeptidase